MAVRKKPKPASDAAEIPEDLYWGLSVTPADYPRRGPSSRAVHEWMKKARAAGFGVAQLHELAESAQSYQRWPLGLIDQDPLYGEDQPLEGGEF